MTPFLPRLACVVSLCPLAFAQVSLTITSGAADEQVLQRNAEGRADLTLAGAATRANGKYVEARVLSKNAPLSGLDWLSLGKVQANKWKGEVKGVPTGGPYRLEVRLAGTSTVVGI